MPQLVALDKRYKEKGFRLIGVHAQGGTDEEILAPVKKLKAKYSIARNGQSPVEFQGIPHMFIFSNMLHGKWKGTGMKYYLHAGRKRL